MRFWNKGCDILWGHMHEFWRGFSEISASLGSTRELRRWWKWGLSSLLVKALRVCTKGLAGGSNGNSVNATLMELAEDADSLQSPGISCKKGMSRKWYLNTTWDTQFFCKRLNLFLMKEGKNCENGPCYGLTSLPKVSGCAIRERDSSYRMDREACCPGFSGNQGDVKIQVILDLSHGKRLWNPR